jgi:hypothetical protein
MISFPSPPYAYQFAPWTDPNGIQWIYNATKTRWARYRVASTGGVSSFNDLTDVPATLTTPQAAATPSIRAIGTGATDAAAGDHTHTDLTNATASPTVSTLVKRDGAGAVEITQITTSALGLKNIGGFIAASFSNNLTANRALQEPDAAGIRALTQDTLGRPDSLYNGTLSGTTWNFDTGTAVAFFAALVNGNESTARTELGLTATGDALAIAATPLAARSTLGENLYLTTSDSVQLSSSNGLNNDSVLAAIPLDANSVYEIAALIIITCTSTGQMKWRLKLSGAASLITATYFGINLFGSGPSQYLLTASSGDGLQINRVTAATLYAYHVRIEVTTSAAVTLALQWGQINSAASPEFAQRNAGSWIKTKKIS